MSAVRRTRRTRRTRRREGRRERRRRRRWATKSQGVGRGGRGLERGEEEAFRVEEEGLEEEEEEDDADEETRQEQDKDKTLPVCTLPMPRPVARTRTRRCLSARCPCPVPSPAQGRDTACLHAAHAPSLRPRPSCPRFPVLTRTRPLPQTPVIAVRVAALDAVAHGATGGRVIPGADLPQAVAWSPGGRYLLVGTRRHAVLYDVRPADPTSRPASSHP